MKILLDECITKKLKAFLSEYDCSTVSELQWNGTRNGKLMAKCVEYGFDLLITIDKNLSSQNNVSKFELIIIVLDSPSSKIEYLKEFIPQIKKDMSDYTKGNSYAISLT